MDSAKLYLSGLLCSAMLVELKDKHFESLCANEYYYRMVDVSEENFDRADRRLNEHIGASDAERLVQTMLRARDEQTPCSCEYVQTDLRNRYRLLKASFQYVTEMAARRAHLLISAKQHR